MFWYRKPKKELDITDALKRKEAKITIGGQSVVIKAFKLAQALALFASLQHIEKMLTVAATDMAAFNRELLAKMPEVLAFCVPDKQIDPEQVTLTEFANLLLAVWCVNDLDRIFHNFLTGNYVNTTTNAGFGGIAKALQEYFGVKVEDLTPTQINAYVLEIAKAQKAQTQGKRGPNIEIGKNAKLTDFKNLIVKMGKKTQAKKES